MKPISEGVASAILSIEVEKFVHFVSVRHREMTIFPGELLLLSLIERLAFVEIGVQRAHKSGSISACLTVNENGILRVIKISNDSFHHLWGRKFSGAHAIVDMFD